jgi:Flp pilus assembly protein TadG
MSLSAGSFAPAWRRRLSPRRLGRFYPLDRNDILSLNRGRNVRGRRRGVAAVEAALLLPVALILILGTWEAGRMIEVEQILNNAAREGGRSASSGQDTNSQVQQTVLNYLQNAGLPSASATVTVTNLTHAGVDCTQATELDQLQVTVTLPFTAVRWSACTLLSNSSTTLKATTTWYSNNGQSYPTSISMPQAY